jgi:hypothetical protein
MAFRQLLQTGCFDRASRAVCGITTASVKQTDLQYAKCIRAPKNDAAILKKMIVFLASVY